MGKKSFFGRLITTSLLLAVAVSTSAHHSYAMYDMTKTLSTKATVKEFRWGAPHSSISLVVQSEDGGQKVLTLQGAAPTTMAKAGFNPKDFRRGIKVEVTYNPLRGDELGGTLTSLKFEDGRVFVDNEFGNIAPTP